MKNLTLEKSKPGDSQEYINKYDSNIFMIFAVICLVYLFSAYYLQSYILTEHIYYNSLGGQVAEGKIEKVYNFKDHLGILTYFLIPLTTVLKILLPSTCLYLGSKFRNYGLSFKDAFKVALLAEFSFAIATITRLIVLVFFGDTDRFDQIHFFAPLSLFGLFNASAVPSYLVYALQTVNIFEIIYFVLLTKGLCYFLKQRLKPMMLLVLSSYGLGLLCWVIFISFLSAT